METTVGYYAYLLGRESTRVSCKDCLCADARYASAFPIAQSASRFHRINGRGREIRNLLQNACILKATGHETFRGHVTVPLTGLEGNVTGIYGMRIDRHGAGETDGASGKVFSTPPLFALLMRSSFVTIHLMLGRSTLPDTRTRSLPRTTIET